MFTMPLKKGQPRTLFFSEYGVIGFMLTTISFRGFLTHETMCLLERIITPSMSACPPNASDGSFFRLSDKSTRSNAAI